MLSRDGAVHVAPLSVDVATKMSASVPAVPPRFSSDRHTATHLPEASVVTRGSKSCPVSEAALVLSRIGAVHVAPFPAPTDVRGLDG